MEWWGYLTSGVGAVGGVAGLWRSAVIDRRTKAVQLLWVARHHDAAAWEVRSNLARTAHKVRFDPEGRFRIAVTGETCDTVRAGDFRILLMTVPVTISANAVRVSWETRTAFLRRQHEYRVLLPPRPAA